MLNAINCYIMWLIVPANAVQAVAAVAIFRANTRFAPTRESTSRDGPDSVMNCVLTSTAF